MKYEALWSHDSTDCCLVSLSPEGRRHITLFENTSSLVNYCRDCDIPLTINNCHIFDC